MLNSDWWNPGAPRLVANIFRARSLAQCDRNSVVLLLHLDGWRKKSVPFVPILESVSLQKYWSTDWNKIFDLHGLQASEGFNSSNSETVKSFPSLSCYWMNLKLRCLFVKLLFLQNTSKHSCFSILWTYFWNSCYLFCTLQNKCGRETSNSLLKFWFEWSGRQNMHWSKGTKVTSLGIWRVEGWSLFWSCFHAFYWSAKMLCTAEGCV